MAPGGEMSRFYSAFRRERTAYPGGMNASPTVKTQCVRKSTNTNFPGCRAQLTVFFHPRRRFHNCQLSIVNCQLPILSLHSINFSRKEEPL